MRANFRFTESPFVQFDYSTGTNMVSRWMKNGVDPDQLALQGIFCPYLGAEFPPHSQSKIATFFPILCLFCPIFFTFFFLRPLLRMRNNDPYQNDT